MIPVRWKPEPVVSGIRAIAPPSETRARENRRDFAGADPTSELLASEPLLASESAMAVQADRMSGRLYQWPADRSVSRQKRSDADVPVPDLILVVLKRDVP
jgi:hypothetical protein